MNAPRAVASPQNNLKLITIVWLCVCLLLCAVPLQPSIWKGIVWTKCNPPWHARNKWPSFNVSGYVQTLGLRGDEASTGCNSASERPETIALRPKVHCIIYGRKVRYCDVASYLDNRVECKTTKRIVVKIQL